MAPQIMDEGIPMEKYSDIPMCTAIAVSFHYLWCQIFVIYLEYGIVGTGISNVIT